MHPLSEIKMLSIHPKTFLSVLILHAARIPKISTAATSPMQMIQHSLFLFGLARLSCVTYNFSPLRKKHKKIKKEFHDANHDSKETMLNEHDGGKWMEGEVLIARW